MAPLDGEAIAARAITQIGTPFRLRGRTPAIALDCVGLVAYALDVSDPPCQYSLKGTKIGYINSYMDNLHFQCIRESAIGLPGDIVLVRCADWQFHLMVAVQGGWVHSYAGLQKVVHTPGNSPWPIINRWRVKEI